MYRRNASAWAHEVVDRAYAPHHEKDTLQTVSEHSIRLTKAEAGQLSAELIRVLEKWGDKTRGRDDARRTYLLFSILQPYPERADPSETF